MIAPPYSPDFISLMLPIVQNKEITDTLRTSNGEDDVTQFLSKSFSCVIRNSYFISFVLEREKNYSHFSQHFTFL